MKIKNLVLSSAAALALFAVTTTAADAATVTVKAGDTVAEIANTYNTTVNAIRDANNLSNVNLIFVGDQLEIGGNTAVASTPVVSAPVATTTQATTTTTTNVAPKTTTPAATTQSANTSSVAAAPKATVTSSSNNNAAASSSYVAPKQTQTTTVAAKPATTTVTYTSNNSSSENAAKAWIAGRESGGSYTVTNGQYIGKYQLSSSYLNGDYSAANQERVADNYVTSRYGSWSAAKAHSEAHGWY